MRVRALLRSALVVAAVVTTACESGPEGPGSLTASVAGGAELGAVTLEVVGPGIRGFQGLGDTRAYGALVSQRDQRHRVVLVHPSGGTLQFSIEVDDLRASVPSATVLVAAGTDNRTRPVGGIEVRIRR